MTMNKAHKERKKERRKLIQIVCCVLRDNYVVFSSHYFCYCLTLSPCVLWYAVLFSVLIFSGWFLSLRLLRSHNMHTFNALCIQFMRMWIVNFLDNNNAQDMKSIKPVMRVMLRQWQRRKIRWLCDISDDELHTAEWYRKNDMNLNKEFIFKEKNSMFFAFYMRV